MTIAIAVIAAVLLVGLIVFGVKVGAARALYQHELRRYRDDEL